MLLIHAFLSTTTVMKLNTKPIGRFFNLTDQRSKRILNIITLRIFADDDILFAHSAQCLLTLQSQFSTACLDLSFKKFIVQRTDRPR